MTDYAIAEAALAGVGHATDEETVQRFLAIHGASSRSTCTGAKGTSARRARGARGPRRRRRRAKPAPDREHRGRRRAKLAHYGLDGFFREGGAFCVGPGERAEIARRALPLANGAERVYVIGDTPADVECGKVIEARTVAVATGSYSLEQLEATEPWAAVERLPEPADFRALLDLD